MHQLSVHSLDIYKGGSNNAQKEGKKEEGNPVKTVPQASSFFKLLILTWLCMRLKRSFLRALTVYLPVCTSCLLSPTL